MADFCTADSHFSHRRIIEYENRPFRDVDHMNEELIRRWNETVGPNDTVYHLGDFGLGKVEDLRLICGILNGQKILIKGNHDRSVDTMKYIGFDAVYSQLSLSSEFGSIYMIHNPDDYSRLIRRHHDFVLYGHLHSKKVDKYANMKGWVNCCVENWDYAPVPLATILKQGINNDSSKS